MIRFAALAATALAVLVPARANAQPELPGAFRIVEVKVDKGKVTWTEMRYTPTTKEEERVVTINGMRVTQKVAVTVYIPVMETQAIELKKLKATDAAGKAIDAEKLAELLKETTPVVFVPGSVPEKHRKLFKDTTVFVELPKPEAPKLPGPVPVPAPPVVIPAPGGAPPVVVPPGEKKNG